SASVTGPAGTRRRFAYLTGASAAQYHGEPGDHGQLMRKPDGSFNLREADGLLRHFRPDGKLDFLEDLNGNRVTATYSGEQLTGLTHSSGQFLALSYNGAGRIASITDSESETTRYTYDADDEHLLAVEYPDGRTVWYSYSTGNGAARENALTSIESPGDVTRSFEYDTSGR